MAIGDVLAAAPAAAAATTTTDPAAPAVAAAVASTAVAGGAAAPATAAAAVTGETWHSKMDADTQTWLKAGKFDTSDPLESLPRIIAKARNAESLVGADKIALPKEGDDAAYKNAMLRLGASADAGAYKLPDLLAKDALGTAFAKYAHEAGMPVKQFEGAVKMVTEITQKHAADEMAAFTANTERETTETLNSWGAAKAANIEASKRFVREMKLDTRDEAGVSLVDKLERAWGSKQTLEFLASMGKPLLEDSFKGGQSSAGKFVVTMTPAEAEQAWAGLGKDSDFMAKLNRGDPAAVEKRDTISAARRGMSLDEWRASKTEAHQVAFDPRSGRNVKAADRRTA